jgi:hypothetical protein
MADLIAKEDDLVSDSLNAFRAHAEAMQKPDVNTLPELQRRKEKLVRSIGNLQADLGDSDDDVKQSRQTLGELRGERNAIEAEIVRLIDSVNRRVRIPTDSEMRQIIANLGTVLESAAAGEDPTDAHELHKLLQHLTGGKIVCTQAGEAKAKRGWLRGTFNVRLLQAITASAGNAIDAGGGAEVTVDFVEPTPAEMLAKSAKAFYDQGLPIKATRSGSAGPTGLFERHWRRGSVPPVWLRKTGGRVAHH